MHFYTNNLCWHSQHIKKLLLVMKITAIILFTAIMQVSASSFAQRITLTQTDITLKQLFREIRKQTGYNVLYSNQTLNDKTKIDASFNNTPLENVLKQVLNTDGLSFKINEKDITITKKQPSFLERVVDRLAAIDVHGRVVDQEGKPLPGATVKVKSTGKSASANGKGEFYLEKVEEDAVLIVSFIGYVNKEVKVEKEMGDVVLELSNSKLDEVQVIAYGTTTQRLSTGNVSTIKAADIEKQPVNNPLLALQGRVPGMQILPVSGISGAEVNIRIRGKNSLNNSSEPLIIIDGLPYANSIPGLMGGGLGLDKLSALSFVNPNNIESIDVLKDADATAIYGSRGANGVVLITTKRGNVGGMKVDLDIQGGDAKINNYVKLLNTASYLEMRNEAYSNDKAIPGSDPNIFFDYAPDLTVWSQSRYTDWQKELIGKTSGHNDIRGSISGGNINTQYLIGGNYHREGTVFPGDWTDKKSGVHFSINCSSSNQKFKAAISGRYMFDKTNFPGIDFTQQALTLAPNAPAVYDNNGNLNWEINSKSGVRTWDNPYNNLLINYNSKISNMIGSANLNYEIYPGFVVKATLGYNELKGNSYLPNPISARAPEDQVNASGSSIFALNDVKSVSVEPQITYKKNIGNGVLNALIGTSVQNQSLNSQSISARGFTSDALLQNLSAAASYSLFNSTSEYRYNALFGRINYNYNNRYILNLNIRRDGSSRFGPGKQFGNFGSVGGAWIFTEEKLLKDKVPLLSYGKLRFSYGSSGNDGIGDYRYMEQFAVVDGNPYQGVKGYASAGVANNNYRWEVTKKLELSVETGILNDRALLQTTYFRNRSSNQLIDFPLPSMAGPGTLLSNLDAVIENYGWEIGLNTRNIYSKKFNWSSSFNLTINRNKLLKYPNIETSVFYINRIGEPFFGYADVYRFNSVDSKTGQYQFLKKNGAITLNPSAEDKIRIYTDPKFYGGFSNNLKFENFELSFLFTFTKQLGFNPLLQSSLSPGQNKNFPIGVMGRWKKEGDIASVQRFGTYYAFINGLADSYTTAQNSDLNYVDASFIRLKNLSFSYDLPSRLTNILHLKECKIYLQGQNLLTITKYKGLDPEVQNLSSMPQLKVVVAGLQIGI
jgi:TonB-linked SusC/RagA family outer membrane protein